MTHASIFSGLRLACLAVAAALPQAAAAQSLVLDDFSLGDQFVNATTAPTFGIPVPGVLSGRRILQLVKAVESSGTAISVGSGQLTWHQTNSTGFGDFGTMYDDAIGPTTDLSAYQALRLTVASAPANPGTVDFILVFSEPGFTIARRATAAIPASGDVTVPFSAFSRNDGLPFDLRHVRGAGLEFRGNQMPVGTYVFDNFLAVAVVPEPGTVLLWAAGLAALGARRQRA